MSTAIAEARYAETAPEPITIPGVYDISAEQYHADPALSHSGARLLMPPSCPARFDYARRFGTPPKRVFDFGRAAHREVLGRGDDLVVVDADDWRTKAARETRDQAHLDGQTPILAVEHTVVQAMAAALRAHPVASVLLSPDRGDAEQALFWRDERTGIMRRAMLDHLPHPSGNGRYIACDYKTCRSADPGHLRKVIHDYGYHTCDDWYRAGLRSLGYADEPEFVFVCQEKDPPYLVTVVQVDVTARRIAAVDNRMAIDTYITCAESGRWPGYSDEVELIALPYWVEREYEEAL